MTELLKSFGCRCAAILGLIALLYGLWPVRGFAQTTINSSNRFGYGANIGWVDWRADGPNGAVIGEFVCSGYIYAANLGWLHLGSGSPANGIRYQNNSATDYGVNHDGFGNLRGCAWGANIGWVNFENLGAPRLNLFTGKLDGSVWGANVGWISLSNATACVQADAIRAGADSDGDGIADAFELTYAGNLGAMNGATDADGDGISDYSEYVAGTDPTSAMSGLRITAFSSNLSNTLYSVSWLSVSNRRYTIQRRADFNVGTPWIDHPTGAIVPDAGPLTTRAEFDPPAAQRYIRIKPLRPLAP